MIWRPSSILFILYIYWIVFLTIFVIRKIQKEEKTVQTLFRLSQLLLKEPKTFQNFDFSQIHGSLQTVTLVIE